MSRINWPKLMAAGLRGLGLTPAAFWALTPAELMLMLGVGGGGIHARISGEFHL